jgi:hypothetical protein
VAITTVEFATFGVLEHHRDGREATTYTVDGRAGLLLKQYHRPDRIDFDRFGRMRAAVDRLKHPYRGRVATAAWPENIVSDRGERFAVTVQAPRPSFLAGGRPRRLTDLIERPLDDRGNLELPAARRLALVCRLADYVAALHHGDIVIGGLSPDRVLWSAEDPPGLYALDCDRYRIVGHPPARPGRHPERGTQRDDCRDLCLVSAKVLLGRAELSAATLASDESVRSRFGPAVRWLLDGVAAGASWPLASRWQRALAQDEPIELEAAA